MCPRDSYIFGGTFDPVHEGHIGVIREVLAPGRLLILAPTAQNPWKQEQPSRLDDRVTMLRLALEAELIPISEGLPEQGLIISTFPYGYVRDFIANWRTLTTGAIHWVVGPDIAEQARTWQDWDTLGIELYVSHAYAEDLHAQQIRAGVSEPHPAIRNFIAARGLYKSG